MDTKCKNCRQPIKYIEWQNLWTHNVPGTDNQIACRSTTLAEPKK